MISRAIAFRKIRKKKKKKKKKNAKTFCCKKLNTSIIPNDKKKKAKHEILSPQNAIPSIKCEYRLPRK